MNIRFEVELPDIGEHLLKARQAKGINRKNAASRFGMSEANLLQIENQKLQSISLKFLLKADEIYQTCFTYEAVRKLVRNQIPDEILKAILSQLSQNGA